MLEVSTTPFAGLLLIKPKVFGDHRGYFVENYNANTFKKAGIDCEFVQDNQSFSRFGTLRGLHFQWGEHAQSKLVRVIEGRILDVAVDLRKDSPTFGKAYSYELSGENFVQMLIPKGFAHGFVVLSPTATVSYKCDQFYSPEHEFGIHYADPDLAIDWGVPPEQLIVSEKDRNNPSYREVIANETLIGHWG